MGWFRSGLPPHQTALAMLGAKAGQSVAFLGAANPDLAAEIARVTGLNGRTFVAAKREASRRAVEAAAARLGTLVEVADAQPTSVPEPSDVFDVAAITTTWLELPLEARAGTIGEAFRLVRPGGRIIVVLSGGRRRWPGGPRAVPRELVGEALSLLTAAGSRAVRLLGEVPGTTYLEAVKPRVTADR